MNTVTILILIDGFLQFAFYVVGPMDPYSHNPYFNRWFSAIMQEPTEKQHRALSQSLF